MPTHDVKAAVGQYANQSADATRFSKEILLGTIAGVSLAAGDKLDVLTMPDNFVYERTDIVLLTKETGVTIDVGNASAAKGFFKTANLDGTEGASVARAGDESIKPGTLVGGQVVTITANAPITKAAIRMVVSGYFL